MTDFQIRFPWGCEPITGDEVEPGIYRLTAFSMFMPLAPKDLVIVEDGLVTGVHLLADVFIFDAHFVFHTPQSVIEHKVAEWAKATDAHVSSGLTALVSSDSLQWLKDVVECDPVVEFVDPVRVSSEGFSWSEALQEHSLNTERAPMTNDLDENAALLGRMLTHFQISANHAQPLPTIHHQVKAVHKVAGELDKLMEKADPSTVVHFDTRLSEASAGLLADFFNPPGTPDQLPEDWAQ